MPYLYHPFIYTPICLYTKHSFYIQITESYLYIQYLTVAVAISISVAISVEMSSSYTATNRQ